MNTATVPSTLASPPSLDNNPALRGLSVRQSDAEVIISGCVSSYYLKQLAQEAVRPVLGGRRLVNRVTVCRTA